SRDDLRRLSAEPIDLVAIDLDGTLLRSDSTVSDANVEAIRAAIAAGVIVVLASARPPRGCREVCERLNLQTLQINHNGALIYDPAARQAVRHHRLSGPLAAQIIQIARRVYPEVAVGVERLDHFYVDRDAARLAAEPSLAMAQDQAGRFAAELTEPVTKVVFAG